MQYVKKNVGPTYVNEVFRKVGVSPLKKGSKFRKVRESKMKKKRLFASSREGKIRRKCLKKKRSAKNSRIQRTEGVSYHSDIGLSSVLDIPMETAVPTLCNNITEITKYKIVYFEIVYRNDRFRK